MRRKLFFFLESLQIPRKERRAVAIMLLAVSLLMMVRLGMEQRPHYDAVAYDELERVFGERSRAVHARENERLKRYEPAFDSAGAPHRAIRLQPVLPGLPGDEDRVLQPEGETGLSEEFLPDPPGEESSDPSKKSPSREPGTNAGVSSEPPVNGNGSPGKNGEPETVDINRADAEKLQQIPGIGPVYAERILRYREEHGPFRRPEELLEVRGIGPVRLRDMRPWIEIRSGYSR